MKVSVINNQDSTIHMDMTKPYRLTHIRDSFNIKNNVNCVIIIRCSNGHEFALNKRLDSDAKLLSSDIELRDGLECYLAGKGSDAIKHFFASAQQGNIDAINIIGVCYFNAIGIAEDYKKAIKWFEKAAKHDNLPAMANLAFCYENGIGVKKDIYKAEKYYVKITLHGDLGGVFCLASFYYRQGDWEIKGTAIELFELAEEYGYKSAKLALDYIDLIEDDFYDPVAIRAIVGDINLEDRFMPKYSVVGETSESNRKEIEKAVRGILNRKH